MHRLIILASIIWLPFGLSLPQLRQDLWPKADSHATLPMELYDPQAEQDINQLVENPQESDIEIKTPDRDVALREWIARSTIWAALSAVVLGSAAGLQQIQNARHKQLNTPKGHALREIGRLKDYIPWTHPEYWCMRLCAMHQMQDSEYWKEGATREPPTLEEAYYTCQLASHCNVPEKYQIAMPMPGNPVEKKSYTKQYKNEQERSEGTNKGMNEFKQLGENAKGHFAGAMRKIGGAIQAAQKSTGSTRGIPGPTMHSPIVAHPL